jgi:hypothetical protein
MTVAHRHKPTTRLTADAAIRGGANGASNLQEMTNSK